MTVIDSGLVYKIPCAYRREQQHSILAKSWVFASSRKFFGTNRVIEQKADDALDYGRRAADPVRAQITPTVIPSKSSPKNSTAQFARV